MNQQDRLRENRREYWNKFLLGFLGGSGLLSVLFLAIYNYFDGNQSQTRNSVNDSNDSSPDQFEKIYNSSVKE